MKIDPARLLLSLSHSLDFSFTGALSHHYHVALLSLKLGKASGLSNRKLLDLFRAAIIHDVGAVSWQEKASLSKFDVEDTWSHCQKGAFFVNGSSLLRPLAQIILSHHDRYSGGNRTGLSGKAIPLAGRIIHLADRLDVLVSPGENILDQRRRILERINGEAGQAFDPELVNLLQTMAESESFWLELTSPWITRYILEQISFEQIEMTVEDLVELASVFARIIDAKSPFTYRHSRGVTAVARFMATQLQLAGRKADLIVVAAMLHDLGKMSVPESILEKPASLTATEFNVVKQHAFYTYYWLKSAFPSLKIAEWAGYHHERLDGKGYPFHAGASQLDLESRIISVADVFTALREERPYRPSLDWPQIAPIFGKMAAEGALDGEMVELLLDNRQHLDSLWKELTDRTVGEIDSASFSLPH